MIDLSLSGSRGGTSNLKQFILTLLLIINHAQNVISTGRFMAVSGNSASSDTTYQYSSLSCQREIKQNLTLASPRPTSLSSKSCTLSFLICLQVRLKAWSHLFSPLLVFHPIQSQHQTSQPWWRNCFYRCLHHLPLCKTKSLIVHP